MRSAGQFERADHYRKLAVKCHEFGNPADLPLGKVYRGVAVGYTFMAQGATDRPIGKPNSSQIEPTVLVKQQLGSGSSIFRFLDRRATTKIEQVNQLRNWKPISQGICLDQDPIMWMVLVIATHGLARCLRASGRL